MQLGIIIVKANPPLTPTARRTMEIIGATTSMAKKTLFGFTKTPKTNKNLDKQV